MKIKLTDGREYAIWFEYIGLKDHSKINQALTLAKIVKLNGTDGLNAIGLLNAPRVIGQAAAHPHEQPSRIVGRKKALARALEAAKFTQDERRQVWEALKAKGIRLAPHRRIK